MSDAFAVADAPAASVARTVNGNVPALPGTPLMVPLGFTVMSGSVPLASDHEIAPVPPVAFRFAEYIVFWRPSGRTIGAMTIGAGSIVIMIGCEGRRSARSTESVTCSVTVHDPAVAGMPVTAPVAGSTGPRPPGS